MAGSASATGLKSRNMPHAKQTTKRLEEENTKMEERLRELRMAMDREKSNREKSQLGFWKSGQMGTLSTYGKEVMQSKLEKKLQKKSGKKIVILQEEKIEPVNRPKGPGTLAYIASKGKGSVSDRISKGQRCGQCEEKLANRKCLECGENFCASCFAVFHLKGALKKHRAVPVDATTGRQPGTPKQTSRVSSARREKSSPVGERQSHREKPSREETPRFEDKPAVVQKQSLLYGTYDEAENAAAFQEALGAWRKDEKPTAPVPSKIRAGPKSSASGTDCGTSTADNDTKHPVEIKFTNSLSYAEKLLLKTSRRAQSQPLQVGDNGSMMINMSPEVEKTWNSPVSRIGLGFSEANNGESDSHWQSAPGLVMEDRPESSISIIEINEDQFLSRQSSVFDEPPSYLVQEIPDKERKGGGRRKEAFAVDDNNSRKPPKSYAHDHKSENESQRSNREKYSTNVEQHGRSSLGQPMNREHSKLDSFREPDMKSKAQTQSDSKKRPSSRVQNTPSEKRPNSQMQNENNKRPSSQMRNDKRPTSRLASARKRPTSRYEMRKEGVITRAPSSSLQDIASRGRTEAFDQISYQAVDLANFFAPGIQNRNETTGESSGESSEKVKSRPNTAMNQQWKISNRLYQMTPRSWRPDNSLIDAGDRSASTCSNIDGTYSVNNKTTSEHLIDDHPTAINQGRLTPNLMFNAAKMYSPRGRASPASQSFLKTKSRSEVATPTAKKRSVDQFEDDMSTTFEEINQEDMLTLKLLQDELADEGRKQSFTVTNHPGGVGSEKNLDGTKEWQGQPTSQEKQNAYLRASVLMDDYEIMEELMMKEESDVKALQ